MKKALKISSYFFVLFCVIALALCYIIMPERTKSAMDIIIEYLNTPIGIAGGTTITIGLVAGVILKVVYDKYKDSVRNDFNEAKKYAEAQKEQAKDYYDLAVKEKEQIVEILNSYDKRIDNLLNKVCEVCETIPNVKVKALAITIRDEGVKLKEDLKESLAEQENSLAESIGAKTRMEKLEDQLKELTDKFEKVVEEYGKREETVNY